MRDIGDLKQVSRGHYRLTDPLGLESPDMTAVALAVPRPGRGPGGPCGRCAARVWQPRTNSCLAKVCRVTNVMRPDPDAHSGHADHLFRSIVTFRWRLKAA